MVKPYRTFLLAYGMSCDFFKRNKFSIDIRLHCQPGIWFNFLKFNVDTEIKAGVVVQNFKVKTVSKIVAHIIILLKF